MAKFSVEDSLFSFPVRKMFVLVDYLTGAYKASRRWGPQWQSTLRAPGLNLQGVWHDCADTYEPLTSFYWLFFFNTVSPHFVTKSSRRSSHLLLLQLSPSEAAWLGCTSLGGCMSLLLLPTACGCWLWAQSFCLPHYRQDVSSGAAGSKRSESAGNDYFQTRLFPSIWKLLLSFLNKHFLVVCCDTPWRWFVMVSELWAQLDWGWLAEVRLKSQHFSLPQGESVRH